MTDQKRPEEAAEAYFERDEWDGSNEYRICVEAYLAGWRGRDEQPQEPDLWRMRALDAEERIAELEAELADANASIKLLDEANDNLLAQRKAALKREEMLLAALKRIEVYAMEGQFKCEKHLPGHPIIGLCAEFELLADKALTEHASAKAGK